MSEYVIGIDGGGTKTTVCIADLHGNVLHSFEAGAINLNGESLQNVRSNLYRIFSQAAELMKGLQDCKSVCVGAAGICNIEVKVFIEKTIREAAYLGKLQITGDDETALYGAVGRPEGIIIIAGTGSICFGKNIAGEEYRTGGYGHLIDDEGSGYAIGRDILKAIVRAHDGREEETLLTQMVFNQLRVSTISQVISFLYNKDTNKRDIAALAPNLFAALAKGDLAAHKIVKMCCDELFILICPVIEHLRLQKSEIAMAGSILIKGDSVREGFISRTIEKYPEITCITPKRDAAYGAALIALGYFK